MDEISLSDRMLRLDLDHATGKPVFVDWTDLERLRMINVIAGSLNQLWGSVGWHCQYAEILQRLVAIWHLTFSSKSFFEIEENRHMIFSCARSPQFTKPTERLPADAPTMTFRDVFSELDLAAVNSAELPILVCSDYARPIERVIAVEYRTDETGAPFIAIVSRPLA